MEETKIKGLKIIYTKDSLTIKNSYRLTDIKKMKNIIEEALDKDSVYTTKRSINSLLEEWVGHNILYKLHLFRKHTVDSSFEKEIKPLIAFSYAILNIPSKIKFNLNKRIIKRKIKTKEKQYKKYLKKHIKNIKTAYKKLIKNPNIFLIADKEILDKLYQRILIHDKSKYSKEEFEYYRKNFFPINNDEREENLKDFEKAVEHHYKNNSHHWQNRKNKKSFNIHNDEEILDVLENILDWVAVGYEFKNTAKEYYEKNKNQIVLPPEEKIFLEHILYDIMEEKEIQKMKKEKKIAVSTLYEINKSLVKQNEVKLSKDVLNNKKEIIKNFVNQTNNNYYMLLCNERKDYTIFDLWSIKLDDLMKLVNCLIDECLIPRGEIRGIDLTKDKQAIEIWMIIDNEAYVYYFFPYDNGVIEDF